MLATIAARLTDQLYFHCPLDPSKKAIYEYGIQLSLSTLASMCSIVVLGIFLKNPASAFIFLGVFFFLRLFSGGYHAPPMPVVSCLPTPFTSPWWEQATGSCIFSYTICSL